MEVVELAVQSPLRDSSYPMGPWLRIRSVYTLVFLIALLAQILRWAPATRRALGKLSRSSGRHSWGLLPGRFKLKVQGGIESGLLVQQFQLKSPCRDLVLFVVGRQSNLPEPSL